MKYKSNKLYQSTKVVYYITVEEGSCDAIFYPFDAISTKPKIYIDTSYELSENTFSHVLAGLKNYGIRVSSSKKALTKKNAIIILEILKYYNIKYTIVERTTVSNCDKTVTVTNDPPPSDIPLAMSNLYASHKHEMENYKYWLVSDKASSKPSKKKTKTWTDYYTRVIGTNEKSEAIHYVMDNADSVCVENPNWKPDGQYVKARRKVTYHITHQRSDGFRYYACLPTVGGILGFHCKKVLLNSKKARFVVSQLENKKHGYDNYEITERTTFTLIDRTTTTKVVDDIPD